MRKTRDWLTGGARALLLLLLAAAPALAETSFDKGLLFRVEAAGVAPSHLFGTIHSNDERVLAMPEPAIRAFDDSRLLVLELDDFDALNNLALLRRYLLLPRGRHLAELIGNDAFVQATRLAANYGQTAQEIAPLRPIALAITLTRPPVEVIRQREGWAFLDEALKNEADRLGKPVRALESVEEQLRYLTDITDAQQVTLLAYTLQEHDRHMRHFDELMQLYLSHDLARMHQTVEVEAAKIDRMLGVGYMERLMFARNAIMTERMTHHLGLGGAFVAIGAGHLPGERGVLRLLEKRGYRVTAVD